MRAVLRILIFFPFFLWIAATGQDIKFQHIGSAQGLSQQTVNCIIKDKRGFMWFGTQDGLNKYDGYGMSVYRHNNDDKNSISNNYINCLYEDDEGTIWIGTNGGGLDALNPQTNKFVNYSNSEKNPYSLSNNNVQCIAKDKSGTLWIGTYNGLNILDPKSGTFKRYNKEPVIGLFGSDYRDIYQDRKGRLWFATYDAGLFLYDKAYDKFTQFIDEGKDGTQRAINNEKMRCIFEDRDGTFWLGTHACNVIKFNPDTKQFIGYYPYSDNPNANRIAAIRQDGFGKIWVAMLAGGVSICDEKSDKYINLVHIESNPNTLWQTDVRCLYIDPEQNSVWAGMDGGGISVYFRDTGKFRRYQNPDADNSPMKSNSVFSMLEDSYGRFWVGTDEGLAIMDRKNNSYSGIPAVEQELHRAGVLSIHETKDSIVYFGSWGEGVVMFDPKKKKAKLYRSNNCGLGGNDVLCIHEDKKGKLWFGTYKFGLYSLDRRTEKFTKYDDNNGLNSTTVICAVEDKDGNIWFGTDGGGVNILDASTGTFRYYVHDNSKNSISNNTVNCMYEDPKGNFWFGTNMGLSYLDVKSSKFTNFYEKDGLPNEFIYAIIPDEKGYLWMSTNKGVSRFNPFAKNVEGSAFRNYDTKDGLQGDEFNQGAYYRNKTGEIFFGGLNGLNAFFPNDIMDNRHVPPVYISSYKRFGREVPLDTAITQKKYIELSYRDNFFSFDFVSLDFVFPEKNKYSYKMEGFDDDWSPPSTRRYATYTNLPGGDYVFRVRGSNNDEVWNEEGAVLYIRIKPPFYKTNTFYVLCVLFSIGGIFGFIKYRTRSIEQEKKVLETKVAERTAELAEKNRDITSSIRYAKRIQEAILPARDLIRSHFPDSFILYKPKDIVSGDFYWFGEKSGKKIMAAVDCTGHGVPGAFMSMIGHNLLNQIVIEKGIVQPSEILNALNKGVQSALKQGMHEVETTDGMDVAVCSIDQARNEIQFAGALRPLLIVNGSSMEKIEGNKFPIGGAQINSERIFTNHLRPFGKGSTLYMFTDGYADQFGGDKGKKFMVKRMNELLISLQGLSMKEQGISMDASIEEWKGSYQQVDDILVIGIRL